MFGLYFQIGYIPHKIKIKKSNIIVSNDGYILTSNDGYFLTTTRR